MRFVKRLSLDIFRDKLSLRDYEIHLQGIFLEFLTLTKQAFSVLPNCKFRLGSVFGFSVLVIFPPEMLMLSSRIFFFLVYVWAL